MATTEKFPHGTSSIEDARYRAVLDLSADAVLATDSRGTVIEFNGAAERLFGRPRGRVVGQSIRTLFPDDQAGAVLRTLTEEPSPPETEFRAVHADGTELVVALRTAVVRGGGETSALAIVRDVTPPPGADRVIRRLARENEMILEAAGEGIIRFDRAGRVTFANAEAEAALGWTAGDRADAPFHDLVHTAGRDGEPCVAGECPIVIALRDAAVRRVDSDVFRRRDGRAFSVEYIIASSMEDGVVAGGVVAFRDVSSRQENEDELRRSRDTFQFFAQISRLLADAPLDPEERLRILARQFVPGLVDWCAVDLVTETPGVLRRVIVEHVDPGRVALAQELAERYPPDPASATGSWEVIRTGRTQFIPSIPDEMLVAAARDEEHLAILRALEMRSVAIVPMKARERVFGTIILVTSDSGRQMTEQDAAVYEVVGSRAGMLIENARLYTERSRVAQTLQQTLLPPELPKIDGLELGAAYVAAADGIDVGGDFYDIFQTDPQDWALVVGDVSGKGADAAAMTALARYSIRAAAIGARKPAAVLAMLNRSILKEETDRFCTACYVRIRPRPGGARLTVCSGGHPRPLMLRASGRVEEVATNGTILGLFPAVDLEDRSLRMKPGDALILFTDGVTEARNERGFLGQRTLRAFVRAQAGKSADELAAGVQELAVEWQHGTVRDDIAVVVIRVPQD